MANDVFNNPNNDYVNPGLSPCAGVSDTYKFKFDDPGAVIVSGTETLQSMNLESMLVDVTNWTGEKKTLQTGEVIYVPGLTKGLSYKTQYFNIPNFNKTDQKFYMIIDLSINYYNNFRYYNINLEASSNHTLNIDIDDALNINTGNLGILTTFISDASYFKATGNNLGYDFNITNMVLTLIDASMDSTSPFPSIVIGGERLIQTYTLVEDTNLYIPSAKYPNGAMLGYVLKANYPSDECCGNTWIYMNNVVSPYIVYNITTPISYVTDISTYRSITFDPLIQWNSIVSDDTINSVIFNYIVSAYTYDPSYGGTPRENEIIDSSSLTYQYIIDSSISNSEIFYSGIINSNLSDSSMYGSDLDNSRLTTVFISDSSISSTDASLSFIQLSDIRNSILTDSSITNVNIYHSSIITSDLANSISSYILINESNVYLSIITDSSIENSSNITDSSVNNSYIILSNLDTCDVSLSSFEDSYIKYSNINNSDILDSSVLSSMINIESSITTSYIEKSWINSFEYEDGLWANDASCVRIVINTSLIKDTSINNAIISDTSIYTSNIYDSSIIRCTLYNVNVDNNSTIDTASRNIYVNSTCDSSISWSTDSSTFYQKFSKQVEVGRSADGTTTILSAAEYLDYINTNNLWDKVGPFTSRISTVDIENSTTKNLIGGFYLFNPQSFPVQVEYMLLNY